MEAKIDMFEYISEKDSYAIEMHDKLIWRNKIIY